jgi:hypothetical protein
MIVPYIVHSLYASSRQVTSPIVSTTFPPQSTWLQQTSATPTQTSVQAAQPPSRLLTNVEE